MFKRRRVKLAISRLIGCRFTGLHWPAAITRWDGDRFTAQCCICETAIYREAPGLWLACAPAPDAAPVASAPATNIIAYPGPKSGLAQAAHLLRQAIVMLDEMTPDERQTKPDQRHAMAAAAYAQQALDALLAKQSSAPGR